jgi:hypothetical protein
MWNPFKKKNHPTTPPVDRVTLMADSLPRESGPDEIERELDKFHQTTMSYAEQESWWHLYGIVAFLRRQDAEALSRFQQGHERFPQSAKIRFSLGQQYERARDIEKAFELFSACHFPDVPRELALAQARYAYLWDRYDAGRDSVRPFFKAYKELKILDDHFLYVRGLPFFGTAWCCLAAFSILSGDWDELEEVTRYVTRHCSNYNFEELQTELQALRERKPELLIAPLEKSLHALSPSNPPQGHLRMNLAVARARASQSAVDAETALNEVQLTGQDRPWLEDIRTLAKAEIAARFGQPDVERAHIGTFLERQPLLFEPDVALSFHLLEYQERLKPHYRGRM